MSRTGECAAAPLGERTGRFALEVDDEPVAPGPQHLTQVQVAVDALGGRPGVADGQRAERGPQAGDVGLQPGDEVRGVAPARTVISAATGRSRRAPGDGKAPASARCTSAVARPSSRASAVKSPPEASASQRQRPSRRRRPAGTAGARPASPPGVRGPEPGHRRGHPRQPCAASAPDSSRSGLTPGWMRRNSFRMYVSPYTIEELDCSASSSRGASPPAPTRTGPPRSAAGPTLPGCRSRSSSSWAERGSCSASKTVSPASGPCLRRGR